MSPSASRLLIVNLAVFILALALLFGPLLPWSPFKPGYRAVSYASADVYSSGPNGQLD